MVYVINPHIQQFNTMITKDINGRKVVLYDSIEDLPITQFHRYSKFVLLESGVGDTIQDIDRHITKIINYLDDPKKAYKEIVNLRQCLYFVMNEVDIHNKATLCLVKSIDGKEWTDFSDSGLDSLYALVNGTSERELNELANEVRKRIDENLMMYFPKVFEDASQKNYVDLLRRRAILQLGEIVKGEDNSEKIKVLTQEIYNMQSPKEFMGEENDEIKFDKQFEDMCLLMAKEFGGGIKKYTTMEFYTAYERLLRQFNESRKIRNKRK